MTDDRERLTAALHDRYRLNRQLGVGGMATVYLAEDLKHHRSVAVKVLRPELASALGPDRFLREIEIAAALNHPHIVPLFDSGEAAGFLYYVMPQVEGETLRDRANRQRRLPVREALLIVRQVAEALDHAHRHGVLHRDVKPENILLHEDQALLSDFGIAMAASRAATDRLTGTGLAIGTPDYMSPEQATGRREIDARSDLYSLGCVLYEILAGRLPFAQPFAASPEPLPSLRTTRPDVPADLEAVVRRCLQPLPDGRYNSARDLIGDLQACQISLATRSVALSALLTRPTVAVPLVILAATAVATGVWLWRRESRVRWARNTALPEAARLIEQGKNFPALRLLRRLEAITPADPVLRSLLMESTMLVTVQSTPPGAEVVVRDIFDQADAWDSLGRTPLNDLRLPAATLLWRLSLDGFQTMERLRWYRRRSIQFSMRPAAESPADMVYVPGGRYDLVFTPRSGQFEGYWIDRYEVTNRQFKQFVDSGGYERRQYWTQALEDGPRPNVLGGFQTAFKDRTGRTGPATWELGTYADGQAEYPVGGVSWYEAAAYCAAMGKTLPTIFHWYNAADVDQTAQFATLSNFARAAPAPVGNPQSVGGNGTYDMAGNVKEWVQNGAGPGLRYILGGGWTEPSYQFHNQDAQPTSGRQPTYGFRCAKYGGPLSADLVAPVIGPARDYRRQAPVGNELFTTLRSLYAYDDIPLEARVDSVDDSAEYWRLERVSLLAAYGNERVPALLYLPKNARPPFHTIIYFPGSGAYVARFPFGEAEGQREWFLFLVRSGRAVLVPVYKGSFDRYVGPLGQPHVWRDIMVAGSKDLSRAIDYLQTRPDIDTGRLAYYGLSLGAGAGPIMTVIESRFKASILVGGGLRSVQVPPEAEPINFLPRVRVPTLMINGREDFVYPRDGQVGMFSMLGTPAEHKKHRVFESGHIPYQWQEVVGEVLDWLDRYLGPVPKP